MKACLGILLATLTAVGAARGQSLVIPAWRMDGGGGVSRGGNFALAGTIGLPVGSVASGAHYTIQGSAWPAIVVASPPGAPALFIQWSGQAVIVSWSPSAAGFVLEETANLANPSWSAAPSGNPATIAPGTASLFFRLRGP